MLRLLLCLFPPKLVAPAEEGMVLTLEVPDAPLTALGDLSTPLLCRGGTGGGGAPPGTCVGFPAASPG